MKTIQELASEYSNMFETKTRTNGDKFLCVKDECKDESLTNFIHKIHDDMLPDDYKYQFIVECLDAISENIDFNDIHIEADIYNYELLKWVSSHSIRQGYCDDALEAYQGAKDLTLMQIISEGQFIEKNEVLHYTYNFLTDILEEINNGN